jgi:hypothetical protein
VFISLQGFLSACMWWEHRVPNHLSFSEVPRRFLLPIFFFSPTCMARRPLHFQEPNPHSRHKPTLPSSMVCARATWHTHQTGNIRSRLGQFPTNLVERRRYPGDLGVEPRRRIQDLSTPESDPPHFSHLDGGRKAAPIRLETCQYL